MLVDHTGNVVLAPDYEDTCFDEVAEEYRALRDSFAMTFSPNLPQGLNLGRQLYYLQSRHGELFRARVAHSACTRSTGRGGCRACMATEVTALGTHTDLWRPHDDTLIRRWRASRAGRASCRPCIAPPIGSAGSARHVAAATGLPESCVVTCGIHDSNASYLRFLMDREREAFTVVSSGTWTIVMANRGDLRRLREDRDMLANVNVFGAPIATARYMGGREYEAIAQGSRASPTIRRADRSAQQRRDGPAFICERRARITAGAEPSRAPDGLNATQRAALATLYSALMTAQLIELLGTAGEIFIDGPLARNPLFGSLLGACVPAAPCASTRKAAAPVWPRIWPGCHHRSRVHCATWRRCVSPGLLEYQANWRHRLEERA